jgi:hypothetical protein
LQKLLDERIDEMAASSHAGIGARVLVTAGVAAIALTLLSRQVCVIWCIVALGFEIWSWFATRAQFEKRTIGFARRLNHLMNLVAVNGAWFFLALLFWRTGTAEGAICGVTIWLSLMAFAQSFAYQSPLGFIVPIR